MIYRGEIIYNHLQIKIKRTSASATATRTITAAPPVPAPPSTAASIPATPVSTTSTSFAVVFNFGWNHFHISSIIRWIGIPPFISGWVLSHSIEDSFLEVFNWLSYGTERWFLYYAVRVMIIWWWENRYIRYAHMICTNLPQREHQELRQVLPMLRKLKVVISCCISWLLSNVDWGM